MKFLDYLNARAARNTTVDILRSRTQRNLSYLYWALFAANLSCLTLVPKPMDEGIKSILLMLLGGLITILTQQNSFWYARHSTVATPDPASTTIETTVNTKTTPSPLVVPQGTTVSTAPAAPVVIKPDPLSPQPENTQ